MLSNKNLFLFLTWTCFIFILFIKLLYDEELEDNILEDKLIKIKNIKKQKIIYLTNNIYYTTINEFILDGKSEKEFERQSNKIKLEQIKIELLSIVKIIYWITKFGIFCYFAYLCYTYYVFYKKIYVDNGGLYNWAIQQFENEDFLDPVINKTLFHRSVNYLKDEIYKRITPLTSVKALDSGSTDKNNDNYPFVSHKTKLPSELLENKDIDLTLNKKNILMILDRINYHHEQYNNTIFPTFNESYKTLKFASIQSPKASQSLSENSNQSWQNNL